MMEINEILRRLRTRLEHDPRFKHHASRIEASVDDDKVVLAGEVPSIAARRLAVAFIATLPEVAEVVDRLQVSASEAMGDGAIADHLQRSLMSDSAFGFCEIRRAGMTNRTPEAGYPYISFAVEDGVVRLGGEVPSLTHKRLAGVLAWWVPGSRDVVNELGVDPPESDSDQEILDALRVVLDKDPFVNATQIRASCKDSRIVLQGAVRSAAERGLAESDAWALYAVADVRNDIEVLNA
jgi:osmotically-inducible protein OsmY